MTTSKASQKVFILEAAITLVVWAAMMALGGGCGSSDLPVAIPSENTHISIPTTTPDAGVPGNTAGQAGTQTPTGTGGQAGTSSGTGGAAPGTGGTSEPATPPAPPPPPEAPSIVLELPRTTPGQAQPVIDDVTRKVVEDAMAKACAGMADGSTCGFAGWTQVTGGEIYVKARGMCTAGICCPGCVTGRACHVSFPYEGSVQASGNHQTSYQLYSVSTANDACGSGGGQCVTCSGDGNLCHSSSDTASCLK